MTSDTRDPVVELPELDELERSPRDLVPMMLRVWTGAIVAPAPPAAPFDEERTTESRKHLKRKPT